MRGTDRAVICMQLVSGCPCIAACTLEPRQLTVRAPLVISGRGGLPLSCAELSICHRLTRRELTAPPISHSHPSLAR